MRYVVLLFVFGTCLAAGSVQAQSDSAIWYSNKGADLLQAGNIEDGIVMLERAVALEPNFENAQYNLGLVYYQQKKFKQSIKAFSKVIELNPKSEDAYYYRAFMHYATRQLLPAKDDYEKLIEFDPSRDEYYRNLGMVWGSMSRKERALEVFEKQVAHNPNDPNAHFNRAETLFDLKRFEEAMAGYSKVIEMDEKYAKAWTQRGFCRVNILMEEFGAENVSLDQTKVACEEIAKGRELGDVSPFTENLTMEFCE